MSETKASSLTPAMMGKWAVSLILPAILYYALKSCGDPAVLTQPMIMFLAVTLWAVCAWAMNILNDNAVGLLLPVLYILLCGVKPRVVYGPWTSDVAVTCVGGFCLGKIVGATGLGRRIAVSCVKAMGGSFNGAMLGLAIAATIISPLVPSIMGKAAIFTAICVALCDALEFKPQSKEATAVLMCACVTLGAGKLCYLTGAADIVMGMGLVDKVTGNVTSWMDYFKCNFVPGTIYLYLSLALVLVVLRVNVSKERIKETLDRNFQVAAMTSEQKKAMMLLIVTILALMTDSIHHLSTGCVLILVITVAFLPGIEIMDGKRLASVNFAPLFFIMGCMGIGSAGMALKATDWLASLVMPFLQGFEGNMLGLISYWSSVALNFLLTPLATTSSFTTPLAQLGVSLGVDPSMLFFAFQYGLDNLLFPYEYALYLYFYSSGYVSFKYMFYLLAARMVMTAVFLYVAAIPFWSFMLG